MTRNQKIALGCGGAGCLGLILLIVIVVVLSAAGYLSMPGTNSNYNSNSNASRNSNSNSPYNRNSNTGSSSSASTMSNDERHRLFQAVSATKDDQLLMRVLAKIGFPNASGEGYNKFMEEHLDWALKNFEFMDTVNTPEKARAYVEARLDD
jgi:hypothetical protein